MDVLTRIVDIVVIIGMTYLIIAMALAGWIAGIRRGEAVTLLPAQGSTARNLTIQVGVGIVSLGASAALVYFLWIPIPLNFSSRSQSLLEIIGLGLFLVGTGLVLWARQTLGRMWGLSTGREVKLVPEHQLVKNGPYRLIRHPMYSGWWLALIGVVLIYRTWILIVILVFSLLTFARRARLEERTLSDRFGAEWESYTESTKSLIPFIY